MGTSFKTSETLLGIETRWINFAGTPQDVERFKTSETLLGIETFLECSDRNVKSSFKTSETLLGIET